MTPNIQPFAYRPNNQRPSVAIATGSRSQKPTVDMPSSIWSAMTVKWELVDDLMGGTLAMRMAGRRWLPAEAREDAGAYETRLNRSYLYGAYKDTVFKLSAKPFSKPVSISGELPEQLEPLLTNTDLKGRDLTQFGRTMFEDGMKYGMSHCLVDFPMTGGKMSYGEERSTGVHPYLVHISPNDLFAWKSEPQNDGTEMLTQIRFRERRTEYDDAFGEQTVDYIRVIEPGAWQLWRKIVNEEGYTKVEEGTHSYPGVPLVTFYTSRSDFMTAEPPLEDLAWMNLAHWQSLSDQRNILRFARVGILFASGMAEEDIEAGMTIGPTQLISSSNPEAKMEYVEHSGKAIGAGEDDLKHLEERMEVLGLQPLIASTGNATATARAMDEARTHSNIQAWIRGLENTLEQAFEVAGKWIGIEMPDDFAVDIFNDFGVSLSATDDIKALIAMKQGGMIQHQTFLEEVKRRGILADEVDAEAEIEAIGEEAGNAVGSLPFEEPDEDEEAEDADE